MKYKLSIPGTLPGLNEYIAVERGERGRYQAARMKRQVEELILLCIGVQLRGVKLSLPVTLHYTWFEPNRRRDKDNVAFAKKFIQDSLVKAGVLKNDGWEQIAGFTDTFLLDPKDPRVQVVLEQREERMK